MATVGEVVDRVYRDWLHGPDEQPVIASLDGAVDDSTTTVTLDTTGLLPEELELLAAGLLVEVGSEQMRIATVAGSTLTVRRGVNGTTAASHVDGAEAVLSPSYPRQTVVDAVCDEVVRLYPDLHRQTSTAMTSDAGPVDAPADLITPVKFWWRNGTRWTTAPVELLSDFPASATDKAVQFFNVPPNRDGYLVYRAKFIRPTAESDDLDADFGVEDAWVPILEAGAAAAIIASEDIDKATVEWVSRQLEAQQFPVGSSSRLRDALLRYRQYLMEQAVRSLRADGPTNVVFTNLVSVDF